MLSRIDGATTAHQLTQLTGFPPDKVEKILGRMTDLGVLEESAARDDGVDADVVGDPEWVEEEDLEEEIEDRPDVHGWRSLFESELRPLPTEERVELARQATGDTLCALCFDSTVRVVSAILDNPHVALQHARLIAQHHRTGSGLDAVARRVQFLRDRQVQRHLFRNAQTRESLVRRILQTKRMGEAYSLCLSRESTDRVRGTAKKEFRNKFISGTSEERVSLILKCEGRCLTLLVGLALDGKAASLLCRRPLQSTMLVQNLARWPATPPPVLQYMARQSLVKRTPALRNLILRHPNAPSKLKESLAH